MNGLQLRQAREAAGVSQERLAAVMGVGRSYVSQIENRLHLTDSLVVRYLTALATAKVAA